MRAVKILLILWMATATTVAFAADGLTKKEVDGLYKKLEKLYNRGELKEASKLYHPSFEMVDNVSGVTPIRLNLVSYFKEAVSLRSRVTRWRLEQEIQSIELGPDGVSAHVISVHTNTLEGGGKTQKSRTVQKSTVVESAVGPVLRSTEILESQLLSGGT